MLVSIITVCFNSSKFIKTAIKSVLSQDYNNIEYIIIDGGSKDGTIEIVKSYGNKISKFISEPDSGIYDAMNKGLKQATGDIIGILNSDDLYMEKDIISTVVKNLENSEFKIIYGDLVYVKQENIENIVRKWNTKPFISGSFKKGWHPPHPTFFVAKEVYDKYGYFNLKYKLAADFELMLRFLEKYKISSSYINKTLVRMRLGGATNKNIKNIYLQNIECYKAFKENKLNVSFFYPVFRLLPKFFQFLNK